MKYVHHNNYYAYVCEGAGYLSGSHINSLGDIDTAIGQISGLIRADLDGLSRYVRAPNGARRCWLRPCFGILVVQPQRHDGSGATDDLNRRK